MKPPQISPGMVGMYFCKVIPSRIGTCCIFNGSARKKHIIWVLQSLHSWKSMAQLPPTSTLQVKATIPQDSSLEKNPKKPKESLNELHRTFPSVSPVQITAALPKNFLPKPKPWLCLQNFYLRKHAMTFYIITTLFHRETGKNKKRRRQSKKQKKKNPPPQHLQTSHSALICSAMGFPLKHILCGKLCSGFFFFDF